jgi:uncharacterized membrane protein
MAVSVTLDQKKLRYLLFLLIMLCTSITSLVTSDYFGQMLGSYFDHNGHGQVAFAFGMSLIVWIFLVTYLLPKIQIRALTNGIVVKHIGSV